ncbi:MAG: hypothetical protein ACK47B_28105 [Armatimonadota bacterium]
MSITPDQHEIEVEQELRRLRYTAEERARLFPPKAPFRYEDWQREAPPTSADERAGWDEFLRERESEREESLARELGVSE